MVVVGTLEPRKNLRRLLEAWRMLDRPRTSPSWWSDRMAGATPSDPQELAANVSMIGFVDPTTRDALYAGAVASVYPSLFEGFGLPVLESMALGCPVVTSRGHVHRGAGGRRRRRRSRPARSAAIAAGLASLLDDPGHRQQIAAAGRARAATYTWDRTVDLTVAAYQEVLG